jgi:NitT/TauT family transport system ATP-binding protein
MSLKLVNLEKSYGDKLLFEGLSFDFPDTGIFAITGKSGTGKTTLLRIISGLEKQFSGQVYGGGVKNTSFVFQEYRLLPHVSALENVILSNGGKKGEQILRDSKNILKKLLFSEEDMNLLPGELSGGMKQRVSIARAILKSTPVLLLDEPFKELDSALKEILYRMILEESRKRLVIIVTHSYEDVFALNATEIGL